MFVLCGNNDCTKDSFDKYCMLFVEIKDFNAFIVNNRRFDQPVKKKKMYEKLIEMSGNDDYITENLLDFSYLQNHYELVGIDLSGQTNTNILQQIHFTGILEEFDGATNFFIDKKQQKIFLNFSLDLLIFTEQNKSWNIKKY